jgi:hypothetical protein
MKAFKVNQPTEAESLAHLKRIKASHPATVAAESGPKKTEKAAFERGAKIADGSIFAGLTAGRKQEIYAMPTDLDVTMDFNDAAAAVRKLNDNKALGHDDWQIPSLENVRVLYKNKNEGALKGTFNTSSKRSPPVFPGWYWSSTTENHDIWPGVHFVRFSEGQEFWFPKGLSRLSCRPVRLVPVAAAPLG